VDLFGPATGICRQLQPPGSPGAVANNGRANQRLRHRRIGLRYFIHRLLLLLGTPFSLLGIVFSLIALSQINRNPGLYEGRGQAIAGLVLSCISIAGGLVSLLWSVVSGHTNVAFHTTQF